VIDIGEPQGRNEALRESQARLEALLSSLGDLVFELDENGAYLGIWAAKDELLFAPRADLLGRTHADVIGEDVALKLKDVTTTVLETGRTETWEYWLEVPAGVRWFQGRVAPIATPEGLARRVCLLVRDITARKEAEKELSRLVSREQLLSRLPESVQVGLFEVDLAGRVAFTDDRLQVVMGGPSAATVEALACSVVAGDREAFDAAIATVLGGQPVEDLEIRFDWRVPEGTWASGGGRVCSLSLCPWTDAAGTVAGAVGCLSDTQDRVRLRQQPAARASIDKLTSCLSREASLKLLESTTAAPKVPGEGYALIFIDLDDFRSVNDMFGHAAGDRLLAEAAERLRDSARRSDIVGRVGGDEFIVICPQVQSSAHAIKLAERVAAATTAIIDVGTAEVELRTSVGVAWTADALDSDAFLAQADSAMYQSKRTSRKGVTLFSTTPCGIAQSDRNGATAPSEPRDPGELASQNS
jgi:diguanylate cyclase (GGDEF)-like protein/PAS domain S-box-containing protein